MGAKIRGNFGYAAVLVGMVLLTVGAGAAVYLIGWRISHPDVTDVRALLSNPWACAFAISGCIGGGALLGRSCRGR